MKKTNLNEKKRMEVCKIISGRILTADLIFKIVR